jgi:hypothetical protein
MTALVIAVTASEWTRNPAGVLALAKQQARRDGATHAEIEVDGRVVRRVAV